jgi:AcrR family transcriptional regulator
MNARTTTRTTKEPQGSTHAEADERAVSLKDRVLDAAVQSLIEVGTARTTTLEVQRRADVSRGALLHHFPSHASLLAATVGELIGRNEAAVRSGLAALKDSKDGIARAVEVLAMSTSQPAYLAELELWAVSRTDPELRSSLRIAERRARKESERVLREIFPPSKKTQALSMVMAMTMEYLRGLALSGVLRTSTERRKQLVAEWISAAKILLDTLD